MDLGAYSQIEDLNEIAKRNNIYVPRLRGYRLMKDEEPVPPEDYKKEEEFIECNVYKDAIHACPMWNVNSNMHVYSGYRTYCEKYYGILDDEGRIVSLKKDRVNRKKRKAIKLAIKHQIARFKHQMDTFNKYVGRDDILYIHARIGGNNWKYYGGDELVNQPWFIEKIDDYFDDTYCDIYARIQ